MILISKEFSSFQKMVRFISQTNKLKEKVHFHDFFGHTLEQEPCAGGLDLQFTWHAIFVDYFGHPYYIKVLCLSDVCPEIEKQICKKKNNAFSLRLIWPRPSTRSPVPGIMTNFNFVIPFLGHHYYKFILSDICLGKEKKSFKAIMHFHYIINCLIYACEKRRRF